MSNKLSNNINIDLHIHSAASAYKESKDIIKDSTKENLDILFEKLEEYNISLFSITDHNRFDDELYLECKKIIKSGKYSNVKNVLAGVELDVKLDEPYSGKGHIIAIFNIEKNNEEKDNLKRLHKLLSDSKSSFYKSKQDDFFSREELEKLLREINLDVILIANQSKDVTNRKAGKDKSLSNHCDDIEKAIWFGFISAFELQTPKTQGIVKDSLKRLNVQSSFPLIFYSDCHDWRYYPWHDESQKKKDVKKYFTTIKSLPTFKGLLMAFTSTQTRFNRSENELSNYIKNFSINNSIIELSPGINVIIGDNGTGKTALLEILQDNKKLKKEYSHIKSKNFISPSDNISKLVEKIKYVEQNEILNKRNSNKLINEFNYFEDILTIDEFKNNVKQYGKLLWEFINYQINLEDKLNNLNEKTVKLQEPELERIFFVAILQTLDNTNFNDVYKVRLNNISQIIKLINLELDAAEYDEGDKKIFLRILSELKNLYLKIHIKWLNITSSEKVKNIVYGAVSDYNIDLDSKTTDTDKRITKYQKEKQKVIRAVINVVNMICKMPNFPKYFDKIMGYSEGQVKGYKFTAQANYHDQDTKIQFYEKIFNKAYASEDKIKNISRIEILVEAVSGANSTNVETKYFNLLDEFIKEQIVTKKSILEIKKNHKNIGNTPGEMALAYYKFTILDNEDSDKWNILIIDQPEDNISNKKINEELLRFLSSIRDSKQIILVTHNPLLVINLDADNVIHMEKNHEGLSIKSGCLEYDDEYSILSLIQNDMDGGYEAIRKRLKIYESNN